jgi:hypothetical protein
MKPKTVGNPAYNDHRAIIRTAMNDAKSLTWSDDLLRARVANWTWDELNKIFHKLGDFVDTKREAS